MNASLLAPAGLFAAISIGLVLLLHIRRQTPPPHSFPTLRFWVAAESTAADRHRLRWPPVTVPLLLQLLLALLVTLALARPAISGAFGALGGRTSPLHSIVLVDGSTSMLARNDGDQRTRWETARQDAIEIVDDWQSGDVTTIVLIGTTLETRSASNREQRDELRDWLRATRIPGGIADLNETFRLARNLGLGDRDNAITLITDTALQIDPDIMATVSMPVDILDVSGGMSSSNVAVTAFSSDPIPNTDNQYSVTMTIGNFSAADADVPWYVEADNVEIAANTEFLGPGEMTQVTVNLPANARESEATLGLQDALSEDNRAILQLGSERLGQLDILMISDAPSNLLRALQVLPGADVDVQSSSIPGMQDLSRGYDLVVFEGSAPLPSDMPEVPILFVQPPAIDELFGVSGALTQPSITSIDASSSLLTGVDLSGVTFGDIPVYEVGSMDSILVTGSSAEANAPLIWSGELDSNRYVALAFSVQQSNISGRVAFPILIASIVTELTTAPIPASISLGNPVALFPAESVANLEVTLPDQSVVLVPVISDPSDSATTSLPTLIDFTSSTGTYTVRSLRSDGTVADEGSFAVHAGDSQESNLTVNSQLENTLRSDRSRTMSESAEISGGSELWLPLTGFALAILIIEWLVSVGFFQRYPLVVRGARG